jgi:chromosome transmission fidelity protein 1
LKAVLSCLDEYLDRFYNVLGAGNRRYIQTLTVLTKSFIRVLINNQDGASTMSSMTINQFLFSLDIDNINIVKLCQFVKESNIIHKVFFSPKCTHSVAQRPCDLTVAFSGLWICKQVK